MTPDDAGGEGRHRPSPAERGRGARSGNDVGRQAAIVVGVAFAALLHVVVGYFYLVSGLVVPGYALVPLWALWIVFAVAIWRMRSRPAVVLAVPFVAAGVWFVVLTAGGAWWGWGP